MAINLNKLEGSGKRWNPPSEDYPQGKFINGTGEGKRNGSYCKAEWANDIFGFLGALLHNAGLAINGQVETARNSQFYNALVKIIDTLVSKAGVRYDKAQDLKAGEKLVARENIGAVSAATDNETAEGSETKKAVTPSSLKKMLDSTLVRITAQVLTSEETLQVQKNIGGPFLLRTNGISVGKLSFRQSYSLPITGYINPTHRSDSKSLGIYSINSSGTGTYGGIVYLHSSDHPSTPGVIELLAYNDTPGGANSRLTLWPDGRLNQSGKEVEVIESIGTSYVRYKNGLQICFGALKFTNGWSTYFTLPVPFKDTNYAVTAMGTNRALLGTEPVETSRFKAAASNPSGADLAFNGNYLAVGFWR